MAHHAESLYQQHPYATGRSTCEYCVNFGYLKAWNMTQETLSRQIVEFYGARTNQ